MMIWPFSVIAGWFRAPKPDTDPMVNPYQAQQARWEPSDVGSAITLTDKDTDTAEVLRRRATKVDITPQTPPPEYMKAMADGDFSTSGGGWRGLSISGSSPRPRVSGQVHADEARRRRDDDDLTPMLVTAAIIGAASSDDSPRHSSSHSSSHSSHDSGSSSSYDSSSSSSSDSGGGGGSSSSE